MPRMDDILVKLRFRRLLINLYVALFSIIPRLEDLYNIFIMKRNAYNFFSKTRFCTMLKNVFIAMDL
jgi:hypothetical protein